MVNENTLTLMQNVIIKSNFNIPDTNIFYRNDYPQIQYLPFGSVDTSDALRLYANNIEFDDDINDISIANTLANNGITAYTNHDGYIEYPEVFQHITSAELTIQSQYETITYSYTILVPYEITRVAYDRKSYITYNIIVYDKEHFDYNNIAYYFNFNHDDTLQYIHTSPIEYDDSYQFRITACLLDESNFEGENTLYCDINNYTTEYYFNLYSKIFDISATQLQLGDSNFVVKANDNMHNITIEIPESGDEFTIDNLDADTSRDFNTWVYDTGTYNINIKGYTDTDEYIEEFYTINVPTEDLPLVLCESLINNIHINNYQRYQPILQFTDNITADMRHQVGGSSGTTLYTLEDDIYTCTVQGWSATDNIAIAHAQFIEDNIYIPFTFETTFIYQGDEFNSIYLKDNEDNFIRIVMYREGWEITKSFECFGYDNNEASGFNGAYECNVRCYGNNIPFSTLRFYQEPFTNVLQQGDHVTLRFVLQGQNLQCYCSTSTRVYSYQINIDYIDVFDGFDAGINIGFFGTYDGRGYIHKFYNIYYTNPQIINQNYYITLQSSEKIKINDTIPITLYIDNPQNVFYEYDIGLQRGLYYYNFIKDIGEIAPSFGPHTIYASFAGNERFNPFLLSKSITVYEHTRIVSNNPAIINDVVDLSLSTLDNNNGLINDGKYIIDNIEYAFDDPITITPQQGQIHVDWTPEVYEVEDFEEYVYNTLDYQLGEHTGDTNTMSITSENELLMQSYKCKFFNKKTFTTSDNYTLTLDIKKPNGTYSGRDFGVIIGDENNCISISFQYYNIHLMEYEDGQQIAVNSELPARTLNSYKTIQITRQGNNWTFDYNNGELTKTITTTAYIPNKISFDNFNYSGTIASVYVKNVNLDVRPKTISHYYSNSSLNIPLVHSVNSLQDLKSALNTIQEGNILYIDEGEYILDKTYSLPNCTIIGNNATIKTYGFYFNQQNSTSTPIEISDIIFDKNEIATNEPILSIGTNADTHIHHCHFTNSREDWNANNITIETSHENYHIEIDHCLFDGPNYVNGFGHSRASILYNAPTAYNISIHDNIFNHDANVGGNNCLNHGKAIAFINNWDYPNLINCEAYCNQYLGEDDTNDGITENTAHGVTLTPQYIVTTPPNGYVQGQGDNIAGGFIIHYYDIEDDTKCIIDFDFQNTSNISSRWSIGVSESTSGYRPDDYQQIALISDTNIHHIHIQIEDQHDYLYVTQVLIDNQLVSTTFDNKDNVAVCLLANEMQCQGQITNISIQNITCKGTNDTTSPSIIA